MMTMTSSVMRRPASAVLHENRLEDVRGILAGVDRLLELLVDVLPADERHGIGIPLEELGDGRAGEAVALVLERPQLDQLSPGVLEPLQLLDRLRELAGAPVDDVGLLARLFADVANAVADDLLGRVVDVVADVVEDAGEPVHVVAVERG